MNMMKTVELVCTQINIGLIGYFGFAVKLMCMRQTVLIVRSVVF